MQTLVCQFFLLNLWMDAYSFLLPYITPLDMRTSLFAYPPK
ncbi:MAG: hypothetical protein ACKOX6_14715 [Bdellovibrio sp.]